MLCRIARRWGDESRRVEKPQQGLSLLRVLRLVALVALMLGRRVLMLLVLVVAVGPRPLALPAPRLLLVDARAQPPPVLFIPRAQRFTAKHEIVVFDVDDGGHHPRVAGQVGLVHGRPEDGEIGDEHARLWRPVWGCIL